MARPVDGQGQPIRPIMRRKSSAQNLLSTFNKSNINLGPTPANQPPGQPLAMQLPTTTLNSTLPSSLGGSSGATSPMPRESDSQSMYSDSVVSSTGTIGPNGVSPALPQGTSVEYLRDLVLKRMITLTYLRNVYEGRSHWFHTILITKPDLERVFNNVAMKKRTYRFSILGMSLSNLYDIQTAQDFLRALLGTLAEYEQSKEENFKPKMRFFRSSKFQKRQGSEYPLSFPDTSETSYLMTPHMPFPLDYHQTLLSLLDILSEMYHKISRILGPSPMPNATQHMMGPLGLLSPHPGVSYLFQADGTSANDSESTLWGIANGNSLIPTHPFGGTGGLMSPPPTWTPALGETIIKVDGKFKKITSALLKELDTFARNNIKDELASLDPLLRNVAVTDGGREQLDFEGVV